jgi:hypothetical protein
MTTDLTRRSLLLGGASALGVAAATGPAGPASANAGGISVATANIEYKLGWDQWATDLGTIAATTHLLGVNEAFMQRDMLAAWAALNSFHVFQPTGDGSTNALLARASMFDPVDAGEQLMTGTAGSRKPYPTYLTWARWREKQTGLVLFHVDTRLQRGIEKLGHPATSYKDSRVEDAQRQIAQTRKIAEFMTAGGEVVMTGDMNIDYRRDRRVKDPSFPFMAWENGGTRKQPELRSCYSTFGLRPGGTHGKPGKRRTIDYVYEWARTRSKRTLAMRGYSYVDLAHSDHDGVVAQFAIDTAGGLLDGSRV